MNPAEIGWRDYAHFAQGHPGSEQQEDPTCRECGEEGLYVERKDGFATGRIVCDACGDVLRSDS